MNRMITNARMVPVAMMVLLSACASRPQMASPTRVEAPITRHSSRAVVINEVSIGDDELALLQQRGLPIADGVYWYDGNCGAWGLSGGPTLGFVPPGLGLGGRLQQNASNGNTGVFLNGRELPVGDLVSLQQLLGVIPPGRYWLDAYRNFGYEGGPVVANLLQLAQPRGNQQASSNGGSSTSIFGNVITDGNGGMCYSDSSTGTSYCN